MRKIKFALMAVLLMGANITTANAADGARESACANETKSKIETYMQQQISNCESKVSMDNMAEQSKYWSNNPDANCDLGLDFPTLPGFNFDFSLDACKLLQAVTEDVVKEINDTTQGAVDDVTESVTGNKDGIDLGIDGNDMIINELEGKN